MSMHVVRRFVGLHRGDQHAPMPSRMQASMACVHARHRAGIEPGEKVELELVGRDDIGRRQRAARG